MQLTKKTILILSPEPWGRSFVSKHHYAGLLAERGNRVYFAGPPDSATGVELVAEYPGLRTLHYKPLIRGVNRLPSGIRTFLNRRQIREILGMIGSPIDVVWSFDPFRLQDLTLFGECVKIYHPVDLHTTPLEQQVARTADVIFSTAHKFLERLPADKPKHFINHGLAEHFLQPPLEIDFTAAPSSVNVGYVGNLHYEHLDCQTLMRIVGDNTGCHFYFIGPFGPNNLSRSERNAQLVQWLRKQPNVTLLGPKPSKELPSYLAQMDMFLMCYTGNTMVAQTANPHKLLEYLSTGRVAVTHYIDEYRGHRDLVEMVDSNTDLPRRFSEVVRNLNAFNSDVARRSRVDFASQNTYAKHIDEIEAHLSRQFPLP